MSRPIAFTLASLFIALLAGCGASSSPDSKAAATQQCQPGYFWNGKECEKQRTIVLEQGQPQPSPAPTTTSSAQ